LYNKFVKCQARTLRANALLLQCNFVVFDSRGFYYATACFNAFDHITSRTNVSYSSKFLKNCCKKIFSPTLVHSDVDQSLLENTI